MDLRTDLVAGVEFFAVRTELVGERSALETAALRGQSFLDGRRVVEFEGLEPGRRTVRVVLLDADGGLLAEQRVPFEHIADQGITVLVTRDCVNVTCPGSGDAPGLEACLGAMCVTPECAGPDAIGCPAPACTGDSDCAAADCASGRCVRGVCLAEADDSACASGERCDPDVGCVEDMPPMDAGLDGGVDVDGGSPVDAGTLPITFSATPEPESIPPGGSTTINVIARNDGPDVLRDVTISFVAPRFATVTAASGFTCVPDQPTPFVEDDFNRPDQSGGIGTARTAQPWTNLVGPAPAVNAGAVVFSGSSYALASINEPTGQHGTVSATFATPGDELWVLARVRNSGTYVRFGHQIGFGTYVLQSIVGTAVDSFDTFMAHIPAQEPSDDDRVELSVEADGSILAFANGQLLFEATLTGSVGFGTVGLGGIDIGGSTRIDDFLWRPTPSGDTCTRVFTDIMVTEGVRFSISLTADSPLPSTLSTLQIPIAVENATGTAATSVSVAID